MKVLPSRSAKRDSSTARFGLAEASGALVQRGDDREVGDERAQLGRRAELELGAGVDVEGFVEVVGLHAQPITRLGAFVQREAVEELGRVAALEQVRAD